MVRDVCFRKFPCDATIKHGFTIFSYSDGTKRIITGFPEKKNMFTGNLEVMDILYTEENIKLLRDDWPKNHDYKNSKGYKIIMTQYVANDLELNMKLAKAREVIKFLETGNKGKRYDYDFCITDKCWGGNSNTVQRVMHEAMGYKIDVPDDIKLPGINGKFYDGPLDDILRKLGEELHEEQP